MKYTKFVCVFVLAFSLIYQFDAVEFCPSFLDSLMPSLSEGVGNGSGGGGGGEENDNGNSVSGNGRKWQLQPPVTFPRVVFKLLEQYDCHTGSSNSNPPNPVGCLLRGSESPNAPEVHLLHISTNSVPQHTINIAIEYPDPTRQLILFISAHDMKYLYMDVNSLMNPNYSSASSSKKQSAFKKHSIILLGSQVHLYFEQWGATDYVDVLRLNITMPPHSLRYIHFNNNKPNELALKSIVNHLTTQLRQQNLSLFSSSYWQNHPLITSMFFSYCDARNIIIRPRQLTNLHENNQSSTLHLDCSLHAQTELQAMYELSSLLYPTASIPNCSFHHEPSSFSLPSVPSSSSSGFQSSTNPQAPTTVMMIFIEFNPIIQSKGKIINVLDPQTEYQLVLNLRSNHPPSTVTTTTTYVIVFNVSDWTAFYRNWPVYVNTGSLYRPVIIETNVLMKNLFENSINDNLLVVHKYLTDNWIQDHVMKKYLSSDKNTVVDIEYYRLPIINGPSTLFGPVLVKFDVLVDAFPTIFGDVVHRSVDVECTKNVNILKVNLSRFLKSSVRQREQLRNVSSAAPRSDLQLILNEDKHHCTVPYSSTHQLWLFMEENLSTMASCGWHRPIKNSERLGNTLTFIDKFNQKYLIFIGCTPKVSSTNISPSFHMELYKDRNKQESVFNIHINEKNANPFELIANDEKPSVSLDTGNFVYSQIIVDNSKSSESYDISLTDCELLYQKVQRSNAEIVYRDTLLRDRCPEPNHDFQINSPPQTAAVPTSSFQFRYPQLPPIVTLQMKISQKQQQLKSQSATVNGIGANRDETIFTVHLSCFLTPCVRYLSSGSLGAAAGGGGSGATSNRTAPIAAAPRGSKFEICSERQEVCDLHHGGIEPKPNQGYVHVMSHLRILSLTGDVDINLTGRPPPLPPPGGKAVTPGLSSGSGDPSTTTTWCIFQSCSITWVLLITLTFSLFVFLLILIMFLCRWQRRRYWMSSSSSSSTAANATANNNNILNMEILSSLSTNNHSRRIPLHAAPANANDGVVGGGSVGYTLLNLNPLGQNHLYHHHQHPPPPAAADAPLSATGNGGVVVGAGRDGDDDDDEESPHHHVNDLYKKNIQEHYLLA